MDGAREMVVGEYRAKCAGRSVVEIRLPWTLHDVKEQLARTVRSPMLLNAVSNLTEYDLAAYSAISFFNADDVIYCIMKRDVLFNDGDVLLLVDAYAAMEAQRYRIPLVPLGAAALLGLLFVVVLCGVFAILA